MKSEVTILDYQDELKEHFFIINHEWVKDMFEVEEVDLKVLRNPQSEVIDKGGYIWFAKHPKRGVIGACALMKTSPGEYELTKMGVLAKARGLKVGEILLQHVIEQAKKIEGIKRLYLLTNSKCEAAIHLYLKNGFKHDEVIMEDFGKKYERCNVAMNFDLNQ